MQPTTSDLWLRLLEARTRVEVQIEIADYLLDFARELGRRGVTCSIEGIKYFALLAARSRARVLYDRLVEFEGLEEFDRHEIETYAKSVGSDPPGSARLRLGAPSLRGWMLSRGWSQEDYDSFKTNYLRFVAHVRRDPRAPVALRSMSPFFVWMLREWLRVKNAIPRVSVELAACAMMLAVATPHDADEPRSAIASYAYPVELEEGTRLVEGDLEGRWWIARIDGTVEWVAPPSLRLPRGLGGALAGDLTGDGRAELVVHRVEPFDMSAAWGTTPEGAAARCATFADCLGHVRRVPSVVRVLTRDANGWRELGSLAGQEGTADDESCAATLKELVEIRAQRAPIPARVRAARQKCASTVGRFAIEGGVLHAFEGTYGRDHLVARCTIEGCSPFERVRSYHSDATSVTWLGEGTDRVAVVGTGCWRDPQQGGGPLAYGIVVERSDGHVESFLPLEGVTIIAPLDPRQLLAFTGPPCGGDAGDGARVASMADIPLTGCALRRIERANGALNVVETTSVPCIPEIYAGVTDVVPVPAANALVVVEHGQDRGLVLAWSLNAPFEDQSPASVDLPRSQPDPSSARWESGWSSAAAVGREIRVGSYVFGVRTFRVEHAPDGIALAEVR